MAQFTIAGAARAAGVGRATIQRALKAGRLSATTNEQGERVIDMVELLRVFGPLKQSEQPASSPRAASRVSLIQAASRD